MGQGARSYWKRCVYVIGYRGSDWENNWICYRIQTCPEV